MGEIIRSFFQQFNWVDLIVILVGIFYLIEGYAIGIIAGVYDIVSFLLSFAIGLKAYTFLGGILASVFHAPVEVMHIVAFALIAILVDIGFRLLQQRITEKLRTLPTIQDPRLHTVDSVLGTIPGLFSGLILLAFILTVMIVLPVGLPIKQAIGTSKLGSFLVARAQQFEKDLSVLGNNKNDLLTFFTVEPETNSTTQLDFHTQGTINPQAEDQMLTMVNEERQKAGLSPLSVDEKLRDVARTHAADMVSRGYFSHYTPEGKSPFDRMEDAGIRYSFAGENLAFAASVDLAMQGLMQSTGHRANILSPNFKKVGIGVIDAGVYGLMFSQEFTD